MAAATVNRLRWQLAQGLRALGLPGWVGLALAAACAIGWVGVIAPLGQEAERLESESAALEQRASARRADKEPLVLSPQQQLSQFESRFSGEKSITASLAKLNTAARAHGVQLDQAEFKLSSEARDPLARYAITLPVKCDYRALRRFTREALRQLPGLSLEEVSLRRADAKSPQLEAQLRFVLFLTKRGE